MMMEFFVIVIIVVGIAMTLLFCRVPINDSSIDPLDRHTTNALKGASILLVFIHHWGQLTSEVYYDHSFVGYLAVTVFLFVAGYVTQFQYQKRGGVYVSWHFITGKLQRIYLPYVLVVIFFAVIGRHEIGATIKSIFNITENWFLTAILVYYLFFFVINNIIPENKFRIKMVALCICIILYSVICGVLSDATVWYNTAWAFPIGITSAYIGKSGKMFGTSKVFFIVVFVCFIVSFFLALFRFQYTLMCIVSSISLSILLHFWSRKYKMANRLLECIGNFSWEFYLIHVYVLYIIKDRMASSVYMLLISVPVCLVISFVFYCIRSRGKQLNLLKREK